MTKWQTILPLRDFNTEMQEQVQFARGLVLTRLPEWLKHHKMIGRLSRQDQHILRAISHGFIIEYDADALGSPDPASGESEPRSIQDAQVEVGTIANFALWLARPSPVRFRMVFHCPLLDDAWFIQQWETHPWLLCHPNDADSRHTPDDVRRAAQLHTALYAARQNDAIFSAVRSAWAALQMKLEEIRYLLFWISLEALFGPEDAREMTFRLSQRIALFLNANTGDAGDLFQEIKRAYAFRSKVAHGRWRENRNGPELLAQVETLVRRSFEQILANPEMAERFSGKDRETYLDSLAFV